MPKKNNKSENKKSGNSFYQKVLKVFINSPYKGLNFRQVAKEMGITDPASKNLVNSVLKELLDSEAIQELNRGKYKLNPKLLSELPSTIVTGVIDMKSTGKAYLITNELPEDVFIAANNTRQAMNGDKVKVHLFPKRKGRKTEGQVVEILERKKMNYVGTLQISKKFAFLIPDHKSSNIDIYIPLDKLNGGKNGQKVIGKITEWPSQSLNPFGEVIQVLGNPGENEVEMNAILADYDIPLSFPTNVENEASKIQNLVTAEEIKKRKDYRNIWTCTIDPEDAKDFDDALSLQKLKNGNWEVGVHIADVSYYVRPGSAMDKEAYRRGTSIYLVDRVIPMLPEQLSNLVCSLRPDEEKLCFAAIFEFDEQVQIKNQWFGKTVIKSNQRYNYDEAQNIIEGMDGEFKSEILKLHEFAAVLRENRFKNGSIAFRSKEVKFKLDENAKPIGAYIKEQKESNFLIEEFMLLANKKVAEYVGKTKNKEAAKTFVYRIHDEPNREKLQTFSEFLNKLGFKISLSSRKSIAASLNLLFAQIVGKGEENMIETIAVRTMAKAKYSTDNIGHYGLAFHHYSHFTSPIRRYPDLIAHRLLENYLNGGPSANKAEYEEKCEHSSDMERKAVEAERDSIKYKQAEYLMDKIGEEFTGLISGVSKWGIFVALDENNCEGMVSLKDMADDFYYLDEDNYKVIGQRRGNEYRLGDQVRIKVKRIDLQKKQMDFTMVTE